MPAVLSPSVETKVRRAIKEKLALCKLSGLPEGINDQLMTSILPVTGDEYSMSILSISCTYHDQSR